MNFALSAAKSGRQEINAVLADLSSKIAISVSLMGTAPTLPEVKLNNLRVSAVENSSISAL
jgi:hypothetical protein